MRVIWKKVWRDMWGHKTRTLQVVLSIAVGIFAVGVTLGMRDINLRVTTSSWQSANPAHIQIPVGYSGTVDDDVINSIGNMPEIEDAEGIFSMGSRWKLDPNEPWRDAIVTARADYDDQKYDTLKLIEGSWPFRGGVTVDRGSARAFNIPHNGTIYFEVSGRPKPMEIAGVTYDIWAPPPAFTPNAAFYVTRRDIERLGGPTVFTQIKASVPEYDEAVVDEAVLAISDRLEKLDIGHAPAQTFDPEKHFFSDTSDGITLILVVMSFIGLGLSLFLVFNTLTAVVTEQIPQIGIMKAVGADSKKVFQVYLSGVVGYILLALLIAIPLGVLATDIVSRGILQFFNMEVEGFPISWSTILVQLAMGIIAPMIAAIWPVFSGARITVREAVSTYGLAVGVGLIERGLAHIRGIPRIVALTISNTFRRKWRLTLTQVALVGGGAIFMMVMSVRGSMIGTIDQFADTYGFDVLVVLEVPEPIDPIENQLKYFPGIESTEVQFWLTEIPVRRMDDKEGVDEEGATIMGLSKTGDAYRPVVTAGRWLLPDDERAIALNKEVAKDLGVSVGDEIILELDEDEESVWTVVGLLFDLNDSQTASVVWRDALSKELHVGDIGNIMFIETVSNTAEGRADLAQDLRLWLDDRGRDVALSLTVDDWRAQYMSSLMIVVILLGLVAVLIAIVGSVGLSGTLSINALERQREIGVMRAIGASGRAIGGLFIGEGTIIGLLSWLIALPLSIPLGWLFTVSVGNALGDFDMVYHYSIEGAIIWFVVVILLSVLASGLPAWRATRVSVRQALSYE